MTSKAPPTSPAPEALPLAPRSPAASALATAQGPGPRRRVGFWRAAAAPWRGLGFIVSTPRSWPLALVPLLCATLVATPLAYASFALVPGLVGGALPSGSSWYVVGLRGLVEVLAVVAAVVVSVLAAALLAQPLSGPALERLVRLRERSLGLPPRSPTSFLTDVSRSARSALLGSLSLPIIGALTLVEIFLPGSSVVVLPLKILITGVFVSWDLLDYPLSARDLGLRARLAWVRGHFPEVLGFGVSLAVVFLLPCAQLLLLPAGVAGATALVGEIDAAEGQLQPRALGSRTG